VVGDTLAADTLLTAGFIGAGALCEIFFMIALAHIVSPFSRACEVFIKIL
jgi:hypothetical protein